MHVYKSDLLNGQKCHPKLNSAGMQACTVQTKIFVSAQRQMLANKYTVNTKQKPELIHMPNINTGMPVT